MVYNVHQLRRRTLSKPPFSHTPPLPTHTLTLTQVLLPSLVDSSNAEYDNGSTKGCRWRWLEIGLYALARLMGHLEGEEPQGVREFCTTTGANLHKHCDRRKRVDHNRFLQPEGAPQFVEGLRSLLMLHKCVPMQRVSDIVVFLVVEPSYTRHPVPLLLLSR